MNRVNALSPPNLLSNKVASFYIGSIELRSVRYNTRTLKIKKYKTQENAIKMEAEVLSITRLSNNLYKQVGKAILHFPSYNMII